MSVDAGAVAAELERCVAAGDPAGVVNALRGLDAKQRRALLPVVDATLGDSPDDSGPRATAKFVARVACARSAVAGLERLLRRDAYYAAGDYDAVLAALVEFQTAALPGLFTRLAERDNHRWPPPLWPLTELIRLELKAPYPQTYDYVEGLVFSRATSQPSMDERLHSDVEFQAFLPKILDIPDIGLLLGTWWSGLFATLCAEGDLDRQQILDRAVAGMLRGGRRNHVACFVHLHAALAPTVDEVGDRLSSYAALVVDGPGPAAALAQVSLRGLDDAGRLGLDDFWAMSAGALNRTEKRVVVAQLRWVHDVERRLPGSVDDAARTVAVALGHEAKDIAERALLLLERWWPRMSAAARADVADHLSDIAPSLRARSAALTGSTMPDIVATTGNRVEPPDALRLPPPIESLDELREAAAHTIESAHVYLPERVVDGVLFFAGAREAVWRVLNAQDVGGPLLGHFLRKSLSVPLDAPPLRTYCVRPERGWDPYGEDFDDDLTAQEYLVLAERLEEVCSDVQAGRSGRLLSLPTHRPGRLDPDTFVARVQAALERGEPLRPLDLEQALLRLPPTSRGVVAAVLPQLPDRARAQVADWLGSEANQPTSELCRLEYDRYYWVRGAEDWRTVIATRFFGGPASSGPLGILLAQQDDGRRMARQPGSRMATNPQLWLSAAPWNRDYAAAVAAVQIAVFSQHSSSEGYRDFRVFLGEFAHGGGRTGAATALLLARFALSPDGIDRLMAADTVVTLFRARELDVPSLGQALGLLFEFETFPVRRIAETLTAVAGAGEWDCAWQTCRSLLPELLRLGAHDTASVLAVAADAAAATGARGEVAGLALVADRRGSSRMVVEARRLRDILAR